MLNPLQPDAYNHIYNRAIGNEKAFIEDKNYYFFLEKLKFYVAPIANIYAYCLMPNHYHILLQIKSLKDLDLYKVELTKNETLKGNFKDIDAFIMQQFSNMGNSYTKAITKTYNRKGRLFLESLQRKEITSNDYFTKIIHYIHTNPIHHKMVTNIKEWQFSSYNSILSNATTLLQRQQVLDWFMGKEKFIWFHKETPIANK